MDSMEEIIAKAEEIEAEMAKGFRQIGRALKGFSPGEQKAIKDSIRAHWKLAIKEMDKGIKQGLKSLNAS